MPKRLNKRLDNIVTPALSSGKYPIRFRAKIGVSENKWRQMADETDALSDALFARSGQSDLAARISDAITNVRDNVLDRFANSAINDITGHLAASMASQDVVIDESETRGVQAATMNITELNLGTVPYWYNPKTGEVTYGREVPKDYIYAANGKKLVATGYWAFLEFGTSRGISAREFILDISSSVHSEDNAEFINVEKWLSSRIAEYNRRAREIMR